MESKFDNIRSYNDSEVNGVIDELLNNNDFKSSLRSTIGCLNYHIIRHRLKKAHTIAELQSYVSMPFVKHIINHTSSGFSYKLNNIDIKKNAFLFISNHRDIILDPSILSLILIRNFGKGTEIAIGDNLLITPWIRHVVKLNRSFIVHRSLPPKELLESSRIMSEYIRMRICSDATSVWIAQREGRAKDSNDRTQKSVLKMIAMSGEGTVAERLRTLNIIPLSINYEYDPCDYLKAKELQLKRDNPEYKKTKADDLLNMKTGLLGYKGRIGFTFSAPISDQLEQIDSTKPVNQQFLEIAQIIDNRIFSGYKLFTTNYIAYDLLKDTDTYADMYTQKEKEEFRTYIDNQIKRIDIPNPDYAFLRSKLLEIYANIVINQRSV